jgi:fatty-acyl-CoA synthase
MGVRFVGASVAGPDGDLLSWAQLHEEARAVGAALQAWGVAPGDHVAILGPTSRALVTALQGYYMGNLTYTRRPYAIKDLLLVVSIYMASFLI